MSKTNTNKYEQLQALVHAWNEQGLLKIDHIASTSNPISLGISRERQTGQRGVVASNVNQVPEPAKKDITLKLSRLVITAVAAVALFWLVTPATAHAASRYWVGSTLSNNWNATAPTNWSATSGGANNASVPGSSDDVFFDGVGTLALNASTISASISIKTLTISSGYTNTLTHNSSVTLTIAGDTFNLSGGSGFAYTLGSATTSALSFTSTTGTSGTPTAITSNGQTLGNVTVNGSGGYFSLQDAITLGSGATLTFTNGTLDANNKNLSMGLFASNNSNTRTLTMGTGTWTLSGTGTVWTTATTTGLTLTSTTATIKTTDTSSTNKTISAGSLAGFPSIWISAGSGATGVTFTGITNCQNLDFTGYTGTGPTFPNTINGSLTLASGMTMPAGSATTITFAATSGTKTITSAGQTISRPLDFNGVGGTWQLADALTVGSTRLLSVTNGTFDANNKSLTIDSFDSSNSNTRTVTMGTGTWTLTGNAETIWTTGTTSGLTFNRGSAIISNYSGSTGTRTISSGSLAEANAPSFSITAGTDTLEILTNFLNLDFTGFSGTLSNSTRTIFGNLTIASGMTLTAGTGGNSFKATSGTQVITSNGVTLDFPLTFNGVGGTFQLADALTVGSSRTITLTNGTLDANNKNLSMGKFSSSNSNTRTLTMGSGTWTLASTGTVWDTGTTTGLTLTSTTATIKTTNTSSTNKTISAGSLAGFPSVWISAGSGATGVTFTGITNCQNLDFTGYTGTYANTAITVNGNLTVAAGMTLTAGSNAMTFGATSGTKTITSNGVTLDFPIIFDGVGGTWQLADALTLASTRNLTITNGTLDVSASNFAISVGGNWSNAGTFTARNGTVTLAGSDQTISGATTFYNLTKTVTTARTLTFPAGAKQTITGTMTVQGASGAVLSLRSSSAGTQWQIDPQGTRTVQYLDVKDSYNTNSTAINTSGFNITDSGNNTGWSFLPTAPSSFAGTAQSSTSIRWTWTDNSSDETGFKLYSSAGTLLTTMSTAGTTSYTETGLTKGTSYSRYVVAYNSAGDSTASSTVTVSTLSSAPTTPSLKSPADGVKLTTTLPTFVFGRSIDSDDGMATYKLLINPTLSSQQTITIDNPVQGTTFTVSNALVTATADTISVTLTNTEWLTAGNSYTWKTRATDNAGNTADSDIWSFSSAKSTDDSSNSSASTTPSTATLIGQPSRPPTIAEVIEKIARGETPTRTPVELQLQELAKQAKIRREKEAANFFSFLERFIPRASLERLDRLIAFAFDSMRDGIRTAFNRSNSALASIFGFTSEKLIALRDLTRSTTAQAGDVIARRQAALAILDDGVPRLGGQIIIAVRDAQRRGLTWLERARNNRLQLAAGSERQVNTWLQPAARAARSGTVGIQVAWENFRGIHDQQLAISDVAITGIEPTKAVVTWKTNRLSRGKVNYGTSISYGEESQESDFVAGHRVTLTGLAVGKQYYFEVLATDLEGKQTYDAYYGFSTPAE